MNAVGRLVVKCGPQAHAWAARRRADRLAHAAETLGDREPCRNIAPEVDRLRGAAARAEQRARLLEEALAYRISHVRS